ncbi:MAG: methyltransferase domain-containing protein [Candidatus Thorarchaeota archaeon]
MKVLDVGSGNNPIKQATVLLDKYPDDDTHRRGELKLLEGRQFIKGDVCDMSMFTEDEFDFVNCTHVLEHLDDPFTAFNELMRVGKSGYIETPSFIAERMLFGSLNHKWAVVSFMNTTLFNRSRGRRHQDKKLKFKLMRTLDFMLNTCHTKIYWGHGKIIKYKFRNESTNSLIRKAENFLSMTAGICSQNLINMLLFTLMDKEKVS